MQELIIFLFFFVIVAAIDLFPLIKRKAWNYLYFSIPVYVLCLCLNFLIASNVKYPSITKILEGILSKFIH
jgi:hypothetical protein